MSIDPARGGQFSPSVLPTLKSVAPLEDITSEWAYGGGTGQGIRVAVLDSGIDASHPAIAGRVEGYFSVHDDAGQLTVDTAPHGDAIGHGTACAGIIRTIAPDCKLYSMRVLGPNLSVAGTVCAAALEEAIESGMDVCNLSLGVTSEEFYELFHDLADRAYFKNVILVCAANNMAIPSYPADYASVVSVGAHGDDDPYRIYYNPRPPVEFGAHGTNVHVPWKEGKWITATGNSFAAPHITGIVARILSEHRELTVFQIKAMLRALATNVIRG